MIQISLNVVLLSFLDETRWNSSFLRQLDFWPKKIDFCALGVTEEWSPAGNFNSNYLTKIRRLLVSVFQYIILIKYREILAK